MEFDTTLCTFLKANTQVLSKSRSSPNGFNRSSGVLSYLDPDMDPWSSDCYSLASFLQQIRCCTIKVYNVLTILTSSRAKFSNMFLIISIKFTVLKPHCVSLCHSGLNWSEPSNSNSPGCHWPANGNSLFSPGNIAILYRVRWERQLDYEKSS